MSVTICPFCGVATTTPHETQELCIVALHTEIARTRDMLERRHAQSRPWKVFPPEVPAPPGKKKATQPV